MILLDVNVLVSAFRLEMPDHAATKRWLDQVLRDGRAFGIVDSLACSFVRIVTQPPFHTPVALALDFINRVRDAPGCRVAAPSDAQWAVFDQICRATGRHGSGAQDAYWASFAIELDCALITFDRGFASIPGLRWKSPLDARVVTNPESP